MKVSSVPNVFITYHQPLWSPITTVEQLEIFCRNKLVRLQPRQSVVGSAGFWLVASRVRHNLSFLKELHDVNINYMKQKPVSNFEEPYFEVLNDG